MTIQEFNALSPKTLSQLTGQPLSQWSRWLNGKSVISSKTLLDCSAQLFMKPPILFRAIESRSNLTPKKL